MVHFLIMKCYVKIVIGALCILMLFSGCNDSMKYSQNNFAKTQKISESNYSNLKSENSSFLNENNTISSEEFACKDECLLNTSLEEKDHNLCSNITNSSMKDNCYFKFIKNNYDILSYKNLTNICSKIEVKDVLKECIITIANFKKYPQTCDFWDDINDRFGCYNSSREYLTYCFDTDNSDEEKSPLGFACNNEKCIMDYCVNPRQKREILCNDDGYNLNNYSYVCENGCFNGFCNKGVFGNDLVLDFYKAKISKDDFDAIFYFGDNMKNIDIKSLSISIIIGNNVEIKSFSTSEFNSDKLILKGFNSKTIHGPSLSFGYNYIEFHTKMLNVISQGKVGVLFKHINDEVLFVLETDKSIKQNTSVNLFKVESFDDKTSIDKEIKLLAQQNLSINNYSDEIEVYKQEAKECMDALKTGFYKEVEKKCSDSKGFNCMRAVVCQNGIADITLRCESDYIEMGNYTFEDLC